MHCSVVVIGQEASISLCITEAKWKPFSGLRIFYENNALIGVVCNGPTSICSKVSKVLPQPIHLQA